MNFSVAYLWPWIGKNGRKWIDKSSQDEASMICILMIWEHAQVLRLALGRFILVTVMYMITDTLLNVIYMHALVLWNGVIWFAGVPWTEEEHRMFLLGLQKLGKGDWRGIARNYVISRTPTQVASHAQKYFIRQCNMSRRKRRSSLFDIVADEVSVSPSIVLNY